MFCIFANISRIFSELCIQVNVAGMHIAYFITYSMNFSSSQTIVIDNTFKIEYHVQAQTGVSVLVKVGLKLVHAQ